MSGEVVTRMPMGKGLDSFFADPFVGSQDDTPSTDASLQLPTRGGGPLGSAWMQWIVLALLLGSIGWAAWSTKAILDLQRREIVSVSLTTILRDFVTAESNRSQTPEMATARTRIFLTGVDDIMKGLKADGKIVLLTEAVAGNSVPDVTSVITEAVRRGFEGAGTAAATPGPSASPAPGEPEATTVEPVEDRDG